MYFQKYLEHKNSYLSLKKGGAGKEIVESLQIASLREIVDQNPNTPITYQQCNTIQNIILANPTLLEKSIPGIHPVKLYTRVQRYCELFKKKMNIDRQIHFWKGLRGERILDDKDKLIEKVLRTKEVIGENPIGKAIIFPTDNCINLAQLIKRFMNQKCLVVRMDKVLYRALVRNDELMPCRCCGSYDDAKYGILRQRYMFKTDPIWDNMTNNILNRWSDSSTEKVAILPSGESVDPPGTALSNPRPQQFMDDHRVFLLFLSEDQYNHYSIKKLRSKKSHMRDEWCVGIKIAQEEIIKNVSLKIRKKIEMSFEAVNFGIPLPEELKLASEIMDPINRVKLELKTSSTQ